MKPDCGKKCFNELISIEELFLWSNNTDRICKESDSHCKDHIRIDFQHSFSGGFNPGGIEGFFQQLEATDSSTMAFIAGLSVAITLILGGTVFGISR